MERKGKELIKQVNTLTKENDYNAAQNKNLELMIKHMDENLQLIVRENIELRNQFNLKMAEKNEEINQMRELAHKIIVEGDQDLFFMVLDQARQQCDSDSQLQLSSGFMQNEFQKNAGSTFSKKSNETKSRIPNADKAVSQNSDLTRKKNSPNVSTKKDEANLIMRLAELKRENDSLRKQNHQMREEFLKYSITDSQREKNSSKLDPKVKDDASIFLTKTYHSSLAESDMMLDDLDLFNGSQSKNEIYDQVKLGQGANRGFNFKWNKKQRSENKSLEEEDDNLSRTTLRKTLGTKSSSNARARHFKHNQKPEKDIYCSLI